LWRRHGLTGVDNVGESIYCLLVYVFAFVCGSGGIANEASVDVSNSEPYHMPDCGEYCHYFLLVFFSLLVCRWADYCSGRAGIPQDLSSLRGCVRILFFACLQVG